MTVSYDWAMNQRDQGAFRSLCPQQAQQPVAHSCCYNIRHHLRLHNRVRFSQGPCISSFALAW